MSGASLPAWLATAGPVAGSPLLYVVFFLVVSLIVAIVTSAIRMSDPGRIALETQRFFVTIAAVIGAFAVLVFFLGWIFVRPPL
jgi:hypothetical protein